MSEVKDALKDESLVESNSIISSAEGESNDYQKRIGIATSQINVSTLEGDGYNLD